jgi:feruloyl-CoA synthase
MRALAALHPVAQDIVIAGHDRAQIGFLIFPNLAGCRQLVPALDANASAEVVVEAPEVRAFVERVLAHMQQGASSSTSAARALFFTQPPSIDAGEITDKGYLNQQQVLRTRARHVSELYSDASSVIKATS